MAAISIALTLATLPVQAREAFVASLSPQEALALKHDWALWARPNQLAPTQHWATWLVLAGRGFGKTRVGAEQVHGWAKALGAQGRIALVGKDPKDVRKTMIEGESGLIACAAPWFTPVYEPALLTLTWPNGCRGFAYSSEVPDALRGPQHHKFWGDELCFVAGTMIETPDGSCAIEDLRPGDSVLTRVGPRIVRRAGFTGVRPIWALTTTSGRRLLGTANHPIFVDDGDVLPLSLLVSGATLYACPTRSLNGAANAGTATATTTRIGAASSSIARCIRTRLGRSTRRWTSTTETATSSTTSSPTSSRSLVATMSGATCLAALPRGMSSDDAPTPRRRSGLSARPSIASARSVAARSHRPGCAPSSAVPPVAPPSTVDTDRVESVAALGLSAPVFNLQIDQDPEYFANGILVHNCKWKHAQDTWDNLQFGLRLGDDPQGVVTTTPRPIPTLREILSDPESVVTRGRTFDNAHNLPQRFLDRLLRLYAGTRLGRQELEAELLEDTPGALWTLKMIEACRVRSAPDFVRIAIAIDPAASSPKDAQAQLESGEQTETGIVAGGLATNGLPYVTHDVSGALSPGDWGKRAVELYQALRADVIVAEANNGGEMVRHTVQMAAKALGTRVHVKIVHASRGKRTRAEPVAALYEQKRAQHVGAFPDLEDQMTTWVPGLKSPDRMDALVWLITELAIQGGPVIPTDAMDVGAGTHIDIGMDQDL